MPTVTADKTYYVDLTDDPGFTTFKSVFPEGLTFSDQIRGVGDCAFQLSFGAIDQDGYPAVDLPTGSSHVPFIGPYRSYYRLRYGNVAIQAGPVVSTSTRLGDDYMSIAGKTWPHYFEKWQYPFWPVPAHLFDFTIGTPPPDLVYQVVNRDIILIWHDLFNVIMNDVAYRIPFDISALTSTSGITTHYQRSLGDMSYFNTVIDDLSGTGEGFDWWVTWDRRVLWASPYRFGTTTSPVTIDTVDEGNPPDELAFTNNGPQATHITGSGAGTTTSTQLKTAYGYDVNQSQFSRMDNSVDFGDVRNLAQLQEKTKKELTLEVQPQHTIPLSQDPSHYSNYWQNYRPGRAIWVNYDMYYHIIDSIQRLKSYEASVDLEGNCTVNWTLEQIYDISLAGGVQEG